MFEGKNDNLLYFILLKLPSFMTVLLKVQGAPAALNNGRCVSEVLGVFQSYLNFCIRAVDGDPCLVPLLLKTIA